MVTIDVAIEDICELMDKDEPLSAEELDQEIAFALAEVDSEPEGPDEKGHTKVAIDIKTSNRPDLWSAEGIARLVKGRYDEKGLPDLSTKESGYSINVSPEVKNVRPYITAAVVRNLDLNDFLIKQLIQIQDKNDFSFGRNRKRTSIGIYNINMLESPIEYKMVDRSFKFQPLQFEEEMEINQILSQHPKGKDYGHILAGHDKAPILQDTNDMVLSMPPIINSDDVGRVTPKTTDVLVETTGTNADAAQVALSVVVQALRDRGGDVESVEINYPENYDLDTVVTPESDHVEITFEIEKINNYLGTQFSGEEMVDFLRQRRNEATIHNDKIKVQAPPWRKDILHWVDISEEIAIAADMNQLGPTDAQVVTAGKLDPSTDDENMVRRVLLGMQIREVMNYTLTNKQIISDQMNRDEDWVGSNCIEITNPVSANYSIVRSDLLPSLLKFEARNTHVEYPHRIFETGECVIKEGNNIITKTHAAVVLSGADETFETILSVLDATMRLMKLEYTLEKVDDPSFIPGRRAKIICKGTEVGIIGEIHPQVLTNFDIEIPISSFEIDLTLLPGLNCKRFLTNELE